MEAGCRLLIYETAACRRFDVRDAAKRLRMHTLQHSSTNQFDQDGPSLVQELRAAACRLLIYETAASRRFDVRDAATLLHLQTLQLHRAKAEQRDQEELEHPQRLLGQPGRDPLLMMKMRHRRPCSGISNASAEGPAARWAAAQRPSAS